MLNYTTKVTVEQSIGEIQTALVVRREGDTAGDLSEVSVKREILHAEHPTFRYRSGPAPWCGQGGHYMQFARRWRFVTCQKCRRKGRPTRRIIPTLRRR